MSEKLHISVKNLNHGFSTPTGGEQCVFSDFNLDVERHEFVAILGPSGCGKSTLLRFIAGLMKATSGNLFINGAKLTQANDSVSFVFQKPTLLPWFNIKDNILFPIKHRYGKVASRFVKKTESLLELTNLQDHQHLRPAQLSGGMQQRAAIARALIQEHDILLMDEPFSALDSMNREKLGFELLKMLEPSPKTVLFVTHSISEAVMLADRVIVLGSHPAHIEEDIKIEFDQPRSPATLEEPLFAKHCSHIRQYFYKNDTAA